MKVEKLPQNTRELLKGIVDADNPTDYLCSQYEVEDRNRQDEVRSIIQELSELGYIKVMWADDKPYYVSLNNYARTYEERLQACSDSLKECKNTIIIGDNNTISKSTISGNNDCSESRHRFYDKHPWISGIVIAIIIGIILMFSFWDRVIDLIEGVF